MEWVKLGDIAEILDSRRIPLNKQEREKKQEKSLYPYCGANGIVDYIDEYIFDESETILCVAEDGGTWGHQEECCYIMNERCWVNNHAHVLSNFSQVDIKFIYYYLNFVNLNSYITGTTRGKLTKKSLMEIKIPKLNAEVQKRIVKSLDIIMDSVTKRREQIDALDALVESVFQGLLDSPNLKEVVLNDVILDRPCRLDSDNEEPISYFDISSVNNKTHDIISEKTICKVEDRPGRAKQLIQSNDILVSNVRPNLKNIAYFRFDSSFTPVASTGFTVLRADSSKINPLFLYSFAISDEFTNKLMMKSTGANYPAVSEKEIRRIRVPLPKLEVQNRFADYVTSIEVQKESLRTSLAELETLFDALMQAAFSGHLNQS